MMGGQLKINGGSLLARTFSQTKKGLHHWRAWERDGLKIVKVKLVEVK